MKPSTFSIDFILLNTQMNTFTCNLLDSYEIRYENMRINTITNYVYLAIKWSWIGSYISHITNNNNLKYKEKKNCKRDSSFLFACLVK